MINIITEPPFIAPSGNPMVFRVEDTDSDSKFFRATIKEVGTDKELGVSKVFKTPTGDGNFIDVSRRLRDFNYTEVDNSSIIYVDIKGAINYYVEFDSINSDGELLSSVTSGDKWAFNGGRDVLNSYNYDVVNYYMNINQIGSNYADFLTSKPTTTNIYLFQKEMLYFLADENSGVTEVRIGFYEKDGSLIEEVVEPISIGSGNILHRLYVQPNMLSELFSFDITDLYRMEVALYGANDTRISVKRTYIVDERYDCSVDKVNILWENYEGGLDTYTFINPRETKTANRQTMLLNGYSEPINNVYTNLSQVVNSFVESTYRVTSLGIKEELYDSLTNIIGTENAYVELGDGSLWGVIIDNNSLEVLRRKYSTTLLRLDLQFKSVPSLDIINRGSVLIEERTTPNPMLFTNVDEAEFDTQYTSNTVTVSGINVPVQVSITGGQYRVNNGIWTSSPSQVRSGDTLTLRTTSSEDGLTDTDVDITVGTGGASWKVTTKELLDVPDTITFASLNDVELDTEYTSESKVITGINVPIPVSNSGGSYSINGGAFTLFPSTVENGDTIRLRQTSADEGETATVTTFNYGNKTATFTTTTREYSVTPNPFSFVDLVDVPLGSQHISNKITVTGITDPVTASITNGQYRVNGGSWRSTNSSVVDGDEIELRLSASGTAGQTVSTTMTIGGVTAEWKIDNTEPVIVPDPFAFTEQTDVEMDTYIVSNIVNITGINVGSPISITPTSIAQYRINGGSWTNSSGTVHNGDTLQLRIRSSASYETSSTATINVGGYTANFKVTTILEPKVRNTIDATATAGRTIRIAFELSERVSENISVSGTINYPANTGGDFPEIKESSFNKTLPAGALLTHFIDVNTMFNIAQAGNFVVNINSITPANGALINTPDGHKRTQWTLSAVIPV